MRLNAATCVSELMSTGVKDTSCNPDQTGVGGSFILALVGELDKFCVFDNVKLISVGLGRGRVRAAGGCRLVGCEKEKAEGRDAAPHCGCAESGDV